MLAEERGCDLVILTNSARKAPHTLARLEKMGFKRSWFAGVATSGDVAIRVLALPPGQKDDTLLPPTHPLWRDLDPLGAASNPPPPPAAAAAGSSATTMPAQRRRRCLHFLWSKADPVNGVDLEDLGIDVTEDPEEADFVLVHWFDTVAQKDGTLRRVTEEDITALLEKCAKRSLPMLVANPGKNPACLRSLPPSFRSRSDSTVSLSLSLC